MDEHKNRISWLGQVKVYVGKCFRLFINEKQWKNFITTFILILIIISVTREMFRSFQDTRPGMFTVISGCIWVGLFNSIQSICRERAIIKREYRTGMKLSAYISAHAVYELFLCAIEALIILILLYIRYGNDIEGPGLVLPMPIALYLTFFLVAFSADTMAMFISSLVRKENTAMTIMPFVLVVQLVMSGAIFPLDKAPLDKIAGLTVSKWGLDATLKLANSHGPLHDSNLYMISSGYKVTDYQPNENDVLAAWGIMALIAVIFLVLSMLVLRLVEKDKRI